MRVAITAVMARAYTIPTDRPEADGTLAWDSTTLVIARVQAGGKTGLGYTYASRAAAVIIEDILARALLDHDPFNIPACWQAMRVAARNLGTGGQVACAIAAVDTALWDLKARLFNVSLIDLMGAAKTAIPVYGSGGFTTYDKKAIEDQIGSWRAQGITMAKIKIGAHPEKDINRVRAARHALGDTGHLFVDANGAYSVQQALSFAAQFHELGIEWFEEPVSSDNLPGLRQIRAHSCGMDIAAGEYGFDIYNLQRLIAEQAVDVLQIDVTRCQGYTGFLHAAALALTANIPISSHCAPALHLPVCCHTPHARHMEYFHDHVRIEGMLFDGAPEVKDGMLTPDRTRSGHGLTFREKEAEIYAV